MRSSPSSSSETTTSRVASSFRVTCPVCAGTGLLPPTRRCPNCNASGLLTSNLPPSPPPSFNLRHPVCIIGAGISGLALSCSLSHRGIPHAIFDKDKSASHRRQGFSLTLQHSRVPAMLGLDNLDAHCLSSSRHVVLDADTGERVASWGRGLHGAAITGDEVPAGVRSSKGSTRRNVHIARSSLRSALLSSRNHTPVHWGKEVLDFHQTSDDELTVEFTDGSTILTNLLVGCDGVHSKIRSNVYPPLNDPYPITPANVTVALGIFSPASIKASNNNNPLADLLDFRTVIQIADGRRSRIYLQPYDSSHYMWQFSYLDEPTRDIVHCHQGQGQVRPRQTPNAILNKVTKLTQNWHNHNSSLLPIFSSTPPELISAYSIVDRPLPPNFRPATNNNDNYKGDGHALITFLGDAAHPMTPFKGWGANAALADGLELGRVIARSGVGGDDGNGNGRTTLGRDVLKEFEESMLKRVRVKVRKSREAAVKLHSECVLERANVARGSIV